MLYLVVRKVTGRLLKVKVCIKMEGCVCSRFADSKVVFALYFVWSLYQGSFLLQRETYNTAV